MKTIKVVELFAGIGGFRVGLDEANKNLAKLNKRKPLREKNQRFEVCWSNQWEPGESAQYASKVYVENFLSDLEPDDLATVHSNVDISTVDKAVEPACDFELLVGGFPCQDYSVAKPRNQSEGLVGKKGVLWWEIYKFLELRKPRMAILENVDRLLVSPSTQRGRDFAMMLTTLNELGYAVEWRVINAADYGFPQRRRRVFIVAHLEGTPGHERISRGALQAVTNDGLLALAFRVKKIIDKPMTFALEKDPYSVSENFGKGSGKQGFLNAGVAVGHCVTTARVEPRTRKGKTLEDCLEPDADVDDEYFISDSGEIARWKEHKGAKRLLRTKKNGVQYVFAEGALAFPDPLDRPSRTIITSEGGRSPSRFKHVIEVIDTPERGRYRRLTPVELERLSGFADNHTAHPEVSSSRRAFFIGNALVTGLVKNIAVAAVTNGFFQPLRKSKSR
jgi:DNA (cytosine-5)-methyltransferase 1